MSAVAVALPATVFHVYAHGPLWSGHVRDDTQTGYPGAWHSLTLARADHMRRALQAGADARGSASRYRIRTCALPGHLDC